MLDLISIFLWIKIFNKEISVKCILSKFVRQPTWLDLTPFFLFQINHAITLHTEARGIKSRFVTENKTTTIVGSRPSLFKTVSSTYKLSKRLQRFLVCLICKVQFPPWTRDKMLTRFSLKFYRLHCGEATIFTKETRFFEVFSFFRNKDQVNWRL